MSALYLSCFSRGLHAKMAAIKMRIVLWHPDNEDHPVVGAGNTQKLMKNTNNGKIF